MLASGRDPARCAARPLLPGIRGGVGRLLPDSVTQHRLRVLELAVDPPLRHPERPPPAAAAARQLRRRLGRQLRTGRDRARDDHVSRRHGNRPAFARSSLRIDLAERPLHLQVENHGAALPQPQRPRLLHEPTALLPLLDASPGSCPAEKCHNSRRGSDPNRGCHGSVLDSFQVQAPRRGCRSGLLPRGAFEEACEGLR